MNNRSDFYDELLSKTDIIKLISGYIPLNRKGSSHWGCCPFHHEKTPSFSVNEQKQVYHCFGCGKSGNAISFLKDIESIDSADAIKILAKNAGIEIPKNSYIKTDSSEIIKKREKLYLLMRDTARHYHENLFSGKAKIAQQYLENRGIDKNLATKFGLGFSLNGNEIINYLKSLSYTESEMKDAGVIEIGADGSYDVFYDRLIFPIINNFGEVVAFGGRTLKPNPDFAKYRNSSKTIIFDKSRTLYGINLLKKRNQKAKIEYVIIAEGYMDVISLHKAGFDTAIASMGTALTTNQAKQLQNYCNKIYISYDGDTAGQSATLRGLDILYEAGLNVRVVSLPEGLDPDDIIKKHGAEFYAKLLENAKTLTDFKLDNLKGKYDLSIGEEKSKFTVEAIKIIKALENPIEREEYLKNIQKDTGYSMSALLSQADITLVKEAQEVKTTSNLAGTKENIKTKTELARLFILSSIANYCDYVDFSEDFSKFISDKFSLELIEYFTDNKKNDKKNVSVLYSKVDEEKQNELNVILNYNFLEGDNKEKYNNCIRTLKIDYYLKEKEKYIKMFDESNDKQALICLAELDEKLKQAKIGGETNE